MVLKLSRRVLKSTLFCCAVFLKRVLKKEKGRISDSLLSEKMKQHLLDFLERGKSPEYRIVEQYLRLINEPQHTFTTDDWINATGIAKSTAGFDLVKMVRCGLAIRTGHGAKSKYEICLELNEANLVTTQSARVMTIASQLFERFGNKRFTCVEGGEVIGIKSTSLHYHLDNLVQCGYMNKQIIGGVKWFWLSEQYEALLKNNDTESVISEKKPGKRITILSKDHHLKDQGDQPYGQSHGSYSDAPMAAAGMSGPAVNA